MPREEYKMNLHSLEMKFFCLTLLIISGITDSGSEQYEVVGPADPIFAVAGEDVILPCSVKPNISVVDMRVEWFRLDLKDSQLVHLYEDHVDKNTDQSQSYRRRTKLNHQELQKGNASLKLSSVQISDKGHYKCFIQSKSWSDDATVDFKVEAVGRPPVITVDGFDHSGGLHLQCESEGWYPEPDLEWLNSEGVRLSSETTETHRNADRFSVKHTIIVHHSVGKIHCRVKLRHHMLETQIITTTNMFKLWRTSVTLLLVAVVLGVTSGILIVVFVHKNRECDRLLQSKKIIIMQDIIHLRTHAAVDVILDADTAHPQLLVSDDGKQVRGGKTRLELMNLKEEIFKEYLGVLGKDGFSSGCFYFEVQVKGQTEWDLGVTRESVNREGLTIVSPMIGYWTVSLRDGECWARKSPHVSLPLSVKPQRVGVFVDYEKGLVSFYDVEAMFLLYSYTNQYFNEKLYPFVSLGYLRNENSTPLIIYFLHPCPLEMKFICLTLLIISGITYSRSEQYEVVGPADPVFAVAGEDVILPCSVKSNTSVVDIRLEWFRPDLKEAQLVHLYEDHEDRNTDQIESYRGRTELNHQELQRGNASLKLSSVQVSDEGRYKCFIQSKSWSDDATVDVHVEAVGTPPVITVDGFDDSGGLHLQCESKGWNPEPDLEWLNSEGVSLSSETTETHRNTDGFRVKHTIIVYERDRMIHCRVKMRHHMLDTMVINSNKRFNPWRISIILISAIVLLIVIAGMLIAAFIPKYKGIYQLNNENETIKQDHDKLQEVKRKIQEECDNLQKEISSIQKESDEYKKRIKREHEQLEIEKSRIKKEHDQLKEDMSRIQECSSECNQLVQYGNRRK
ncbi:butyrophilin subfamily 1 member A1 [Labeo rohita]|uniref:butyrophilin subfamily 1 member A1 n=1 Tax=Labeo rohita TaxID=84645 RepID=UPI0021E2B4AA|nr:butyrophilin subfamily 1 member A1 [Labeo rohita]